MSEYELFRKAVTKSSGTHPGGFSSDIFLPRCCDQAFWRQKGPRGREETWTVPCLGCTELLSCRLETDSPAGTQDLLLTRASP